MARYTKQTYDMVAMVLKDTVETFTEGSATPAHTLGALVAAHQVKVFSAVFAADNPAFRAGKFYKAVFGEEPFDTIKSLAGRGKGTVLPPR